MIVIFRHGETIGNKDNLYQGWTDTPLTYNGRLQVKLTSDHFIRFIKHREFFIQDIFCSSCQRSITSAKILHNKLPELSLSVCDSLRERNYGKYEQSKINFDTQTKDFTERYQDEGESFAEMYERISRFLDLTKLRTDHPMRLIIFHCHLNVSKILRGIYMRLSPEHFMKFKHNHLHYYIIDQHICTEVKCED